MLPKELELLTTNGSLADAKSAIPVAAPDAETEYASFGDARYGTLCSYDWLGEYGDCDVELPLDLELSVAELV